ncbi:MULTISPECIES: NAD-dependent epimerase/dehydratase family protein [unclassified Pseudomonas]|uniref:NAD-dependent epimerase/dehydratase family protein n=1 Tax=unclassified Pseudomonas TaxID=196821 RepID=UPI0015A0C899|nr:MULTISPECIES: NAD-dependent epimerase/dehydratase family protein [unclassified Pseudomonas]NWC95268.1 NAD-dependent epimerase/dehydratase family protein [Pseudomonas sp. IPO3779]NWD17132.1 NAD-dependent epimerase/dehydratase family protein [Pseudomonas sp. IPO3778]
MKILVTGATGFVGRSLCAHLVAQGHDVTAFVRNGAHGLADVKVATGALDDEDFVTRTLTEIDCVVHLAGRAHQLDDNSDNPLEAFRIVNRDATLVLAACARQAGVKRFVFISSIGVNGSSTTVEPFCEDSAATPLADYAISKHEAELELSRLKCDDFDVVIVRPPLVYAAHAPGNFARLLKLVSAGVPVPFASLTNQRSMIALENLVDFISLCVVHPAAANELFLISDGIDVSTPQIFRYLAQGMGKRSIHFYFPQPLIHAAAKMIGKEALYKQLCGSLVVDSGKARKLLGWKPLLSPEQALIRSGTLYKQQRT